MRIVNESVGVIDRLFKYAAFFKVNNKKMNLLEVWDYKWKR